MRLLAYFCYTLLYSRFNGIQHADIRNTKNKYMKNVRDFKGIWIPKEIWLNRSLTVMEKLFLVEISSLDNNDGCFEPNSYFSDWSGLTKSRCSQIINSLEKKEMIEIELIKDGKEVKKRIVKIVK